MIRNINLNSFKCFESLSLPLNQLTILSGQNASGKSTVLQAFGLLHQTIIDEEWSKKLILNGSILRFGTVSDVVNKIHGRNCFEIGLQTCDVDCNWFFSGERHEMSMNIDKLFFNGVEYKNIDVYRNLFPVTITTETLSLSRQLQRMTYLAAERIGPREVYPLEDGRKSMVVGPAGENSVNVLHWGRDELPIPDLIIDGVPETRIRQAEERMRMFFPGCSFDISQIAKVNAITLGFRTSLDTDYHRPVHVGFGLTQVFPIIVAALSAEKGDILLIENPEVHLHPYGQAVMGQFLAEVARAGVQVILETHSDHILNGIRRSVKNDSINYKNVTIYFFRQNLDGLNQILNPQINKFGKIDFWPEGFFDQYEIDMNYFAGWSD